ncbi:hypothetical protein EDD15DRAFT_2201238 [Pisolithus albus]|nr:hypothetical protein EDD15DRAFT_2201238 [Pisolithus albus]
MPKDDGCVKRRETRGDECALVHEIGNISASKAPYHVLGKREVWPRTEGDIPYATSQHSRGMGRDSEKGTTVQEKERPPSNDRWGNQYQNVGSGRGHLGGHGEKEIKPIGASSPEISAKPPCAPLYTKKTQISTMAKRLAMKKVSPSRHERPVPLCRLGDPRLKDANDSAWNCLSYGPNEVGARRAASHCDVRGELGEHGNKGNSAPNPEIFAKPSCTLLYTEKTHISATNEHEAMKMASPGSQ